MSRDDDLEFYDDISDAYDEDEDYTYEDRPVRRARRDDRRYDRRNAYEDDVDDRDPDEDYDDRRRSRDDDYDDRYDDAEDYDDYDEEDDDRKAARGRGGKGGGVRRVLNWVIPFVMLAIIVVAGGLFIRDFLTYKQASDEYALVKERIVIPEDEPLVEEDGITYPDLDIDLDALQAMNEDFVCVIYIPALELYYPVAHSKDNQEYLTTTFEGTYNPSGCIFLDANASEDFSDINTFIYGHNMKNETMFGILKEFSAKEDLCASDPYVYLYLRDGSVLKYHIFAYYTTPVDDPLYNAIEGDKAYDAYVQRAQSRSYYEPSEDEADDFTLRPNLLTLSTCWGTDHKNNFVVQSALIGKADRAVAVTEDVEEGTAATAN